MKMLIKKILSTLVILFLVACVIKGTKLKKRSDIEQSTICEIFDSIYIDSSCLVYKIGQKQIRYCLPNIVGYERLALLNKKKDQVIVTYSSTNHVSNVILFVHVIKEKHPTIFHLVSISPCQSCNPFKINTNEASIDFVLEDKDKSELFEQLIDSQILNNNSNRLLFENMSLEKLIEYSSNIQRYESAISIDYIKKIIERQPIDIKTIVNYNNLAFYLQKGLAFKQSSYLLELILDKFANRTVAYINLGDAYWGLEENSKAKDAYSKYIALMKANGKENKIPQRIFERIK